MFLRQEISKYLLNIYWYLLIFQNLLIFQDIYWKLVLVDLLDLYAVYTNEDDNHPPNYYDPLVL